MGWVDNATSRQFSFRERPGTHCIGDWVGPSAGLDGCEKSRSHRDLIPGPSFVARGCASSEKHGSVRDKYSNKGTSRTME